MTRAHPTPLRPPPTAAQEPRDRPISPPASLPRARPAPPAIPWPLPVPDDRPVQWGRGAREERGDVRLLAVDTRHGRLLDRAAADLPELLLPGDLVVLNDAATLPASLSGRAPSGAPIEIRLAGPAGERGRWPAVLFGAGDWHMRTEDRPPPERLAPGDRIRLGDEPGAADRDALTAEIASVSPISPRLVELDFDRAGARLLAALYRHGRPVQYSHQDRDLALWSVQTAFAGPPWAVEMPSAGRPLSWQILAGLRRRGVELAWLTHAAGLSSTGDAALDAALPLPEQYDIPRATAHAVHRAAAEGRRVIAVGTTVVRALEGAARSGRWAGGAGTTDLVLDAGSVIRVVDGVVTGVHAPGESHYRLLGAFAPPALLDAAWRHARARGYLQHELGDLCLFAPGLAGAEPAVSAPRPTAARP
ncbi:MAG TPA: S-adenosylmethionine:tRNA ribosyltransferase-isomerase [Kofleriaceae bacterium]|nr:S-adenosylmethionine:tRNA ribosyltransferase-isomerase [Kofleriaceae bacterium]